MFASGGRPEVLRKGEPLSAAVGRLSGGRRYTSLVPTQLRRYLDEEPDALRSMDLTPVRRA